MKTYEGPTKAFPSFTARLASSLASNWDLFCCLYGVQVSSL